MSHFYQRADIVVLGRTEGKTTPQVFSVDRVWKGAVPANVAVSRFGGYATRRDYVLFAHGPDHRGLYYADACFFWGVRETVSVLENVYGAGSRPTDAVDWFGRSWLAFVAILGSIGISSLVWQHVITIANVRR